MSVARRKALRAIVTSVVASAAAATFVVAGPEAQAAPAAAPAAKAKALPAFTITRNGDGAYGHIIRVYPHSSVKGVTFTYQWLHGTTPLAGGTKYGHLVALTDSGRTIRVKITAHAPGYAARSQTYTIKTPPRIKVQTMPASVVAAAKLPAGSGIWYYTYNGRRWVQVRQGVTNAMYNLAPRQYKVFIAKGGAAKVGVPVRPTACGLPDSGCLNQMTRGTLYTTPHATGWTTARGVRGDLLSVATSQVGYHAVLGYYALHNTKYNEWTGVGGAWCSFFQAWVANRAGHSSIIPKHTNYWTGYYDRLVKYGTRLSAPKVGSYALVSYGTHYHHTQLITWVSPDKKTFKIIEGNWGEKVGTRTMTVGSTNAPQMFYDPKGLPS